MIGGCSSHNGMVFARGHKEDFDRWSSSGLTNWSYEKVLSTVKKVCTGEAEIPSINPVSGDTIIII